ncbi:protein phosphatase 1 regulatory subunit 37-like [Mercenaria mercenaria]|uniref:protein phosphatase 1 regulatory subunit 37-like n=1 Tax=Mercenaria mercenaria TaxID=6596 RepID=UPI00234E87A3|nr:protein phosphatase 1 regulatory subunit 37-like [Mercenaria mercenaria]
MDATVNSDVSSTSTCENDKINSEKSDQENSPSSTSKQEVNKQVVELPNDDTRKDEQVPVEQLSNDANVNDEQVIANGCSNAEKQTKKGKKNVFFPVDATIVKGYLEPPDPWKNVPDWRTEDLLRAYRKGCEKHGSKPLNKILQQLQCIENVGERYEILSLKGERLDLKQVESLEDIFKHVRFRCIDVEATHLDDEMAVALFEMVEYYESACKLNISFNKGIGPRGWMSCSKLVRRTPCLTFIDARNCDLNERVIPIMGRALRMGCFLQRLHLQNAGLAGRALVILVAALKMNEILKELFLGDNKFMPTDGVQIGNLLKYNHRLELLDLRNNHLQDVGVGHICDGLSEQCLDTGLLTLVLWNNQITFQGMSAVNKALTSAEHLETLNLGHNPITNEGIHILKDGLLKSKGLLKLGLSGTKVSCEGAVALAEVIADNTRLVRLDLQENDIKTAGLMALSLALKVNESITRLDIDRETKKESGVKDYADQQKRLQKDISCLLERNRDLMHKREEEQRQIELKNQENARKLQEAACDISFEESHEYIPSGDGIHRPKLLFLPLTPLCPERELDSPVLGEEYILEATPPAQTIQLAPPTGTDLLSPQYCPNPKATAKKIFSVTRVASPTGLSPQGSDSSSGFKFPKFSSSVADVINSPTQVHPPMGRGADSSTSQVLPHLVPPLPTVDLPTLTTPIPLSVDMHTAGDKASPGSLQRVIEDQTLVSYIQQIVDDNAVKVNAKTDDISDQSKPEEKKSEVVHNSTNNATGKTNQMTSVTVESVKQDSCDKTSNDSDRSDSSEINAEQQTSKVKVKSSEKKGGENAEKSRDDKSKDDSEQLNESSTKTDSSSKCDILPVENIPEAEDIIKPEVETQSKKEKQQIKSDENCLKTESKACSKTAVDVDSAGSSQAEDLSILDCDSDKLQNSEPKSLSELDMPNLSENLCDDDTKEDDMNGEFVDCLDTEDNVCDTETDKNVVNRDGKGQNGSDKENGDSEPWNTVNESDIVESMSSVQSSDSLHTGSNNKPDFHTNLSFNGLRQELASLIDEEVGSSSGTQSPPANGIILKNGNTDAYTQNGAETNSDWLDTAAMDTGASS